MENEFIRKYSKQLIEFINDSSNYKNVLCVSGARQVGKTTLIKKIVQNRPHLIIDFEKDPSLAEKIDEYSGFADFTGYLKDTFKFDPSRQILFVDEAQKSKKLGSFVRFMKEDWLKATVILSGSLLSELYAEGDRVAVGREAYLEMWPLTFKEFLMALEQDSLVQALQEFKLGNDLSEARHNRLLEWYDQYLLVGGLPEVVKFYKNKKDFKKLRANIYKSYEDDFARYFGVEDINLFKRALQAVAANVGSPSKDSQVVRVDGPGYKKVASIFSRLEKWKLVVKYEQVGLRPEQNYFFPKRYLYDTGILCDLRLRGLQTISVKDASHPVLRTPLGGLIENTVAISLRSQFVDNCFGLRLNQQTEIDFSIKKNGVVYPVECKLSLRFKENYTSALRHYLATYTTKGFGFLLYGGPPLTEQKSGCWALPYYLADEMERLVGLE